MKTTATTTNTCLILAAALSLAPSEGAAQITCNQRDNVLGHLARKYQEVPVAIGVTDRGGLVEVLSTGDGKTWNIIISTPDGQSCLVAAGEGWRAVPKAAGSADPKA